MRHKLPGPLNFSRPPQLRMIGKPAGSSTKKLIHVNSCAQIVGSNIIPNISAILQRVGCPNNFHT